MRLDGKRVYEGSEFELEQHHHRSSTKTKLQEVHSDIIATMRNTFKVIAMLHWMYSGPILRISTYVTACVYIFHLILSKFGRMQLLIIIL